MALSQILRIGITCSQKEKKNSRTAINQIGRLWINCPRQIPLKFEKSHGVVDNKKNRGGAGRGRKERTQRAAQEDGNSHQEAAGIISGQIGNTRPIGARELVHSDTLGRY